jgi:hypothetical protein
MQELFVQFQDGGTPQALLQTANEEYIPDPLPGSIQKFPTQSQDAGAAANISNELGN